MTVELFIDGIIILMVAILIGVAIKLNFRLKKFRGAQQEMATMVGQLNEIIATAQQSILSLKQAAGTEEVRLRELLDKARAMADELSMINDTGSNLANRIEQGLIPDERRDEKAMGQAIGNKIQGNKIQNEKIQGEKIQGDKALSEKPGVSAGDGAGHHAEDEESEMMKTLRNIR